ncbi:MAG: FhaA domain-containing protein [Pyrinomonadaceae bacterium]
MSDLGILDKVRRWIDGESAELVLEQAARDASVKPRSKAEEFIVKIAREVETVMQNEMVPLPQGTTILPSEYIIFLSSEDDKEWRGVKRKGLEQGLYHILAERAKEIAGRKKLETRSFVIELRVDGTMEKGEVRIQHSWEDSSGNKTGVLVRPKMPEVSSVLASGGPTSPNLRPSSKPDTAPATFEPGTATSRISQALPIQMEDLPEEMTAVASRSPELYKLEVWHHGVRQNVVPIFQKEIVVGRGSKSKPVDISLAGDVEVSRRHATISTDGTGNFWVENQGKNPAVVDNFELSTGERISLAAGAYLKICSYMLRIQPR